MISCACGSLFYPGARAPDFFSDLTATYTALGFDLSKPEEVVARYRLAAGPDRSLPPPEAFPYNTAIIPFGAAPPH
jgi:hypothetical protein